jgi:hypothetical protein
VIQKCSAVQLVCTLSFLVDDANTSGALDVAEILEISEFGLKDIESDLDTWDADSDGEGSSDWMSSIVSIDSTA